MKQEPDPRARALDLLARREHSRYELISKLTAKGFDPDEVEALVGELAERGWQSDKRFTEVYIRSRISAGHGPLRIRQELKQRRVDEQLAADSLEQADVDWAELCAEIQARKFGRLPGRDPKEKARQIRFLQYRGFSLDLIMRTLNRSHD